MKQYGIYSSFIILICLLALSIGNSQSTENVATDNEGLSGKQLAKTYCSTCHLLPEPQLLDKKTWEKGVLPNMALRLELKMAGK